MATSKINGKLNIELFSGAGGQLLGLYNAGFRNWNVYEWDKDSIRTLKSNFTQNKNYYINIFDTDVTKVNWKTIDQDVCLLSAGPPCQPFSQGGKHLAQSDERNLFPEVIRAMNNLSPQAVVIENVPGIIRRQSRPYFYYIIRQLETPSHSPSEKCSWNSHFQVLINERRKYPNNLEYNVVSKVIEAADYGIPQRRTRIFIIATRKDCPTFRYPSQTHSETALYYRLDNGKYWKRHEIKRKRANPRFNQNRILVNDGLEPWVTVRDAISDLPKPANSESHSENNHWRIPGARSYHGHSGSDYDFPSKTIKAGVHGVPGGENTLRIPGNRVRYFTLRELARLQTFPDWFSFKGARSSVIRQIGNAVPVNLAEMIGVKIHKLLQQYKER